MARLLAAVVAVFAVSAVAACGGGDAEETRVADTVEGIQSDLADGKVADVCAAMSKRAQRQIGTVGHGTQPTTCTRDLRALLSSVAAPLANPWDGVDLRKGPHPKVVDVEVGSGGANATVTMALEKGGQFVARLVDDGDGWKLDDFWGAVAPPPRALR